jgi:hypothetical protein
MFFSFDILRFWFLFEPYLSGVVRMPQNLADLLEFPSEPVLDILDNLKLKGSLATLARQFLEIEAT